MNRQDTLNEFFYKVANLSLSDARNAEVARNILTNLITEAKAARQRFATDAPIRNCPRCASADIIALGEWEARSLDSTDRSNTATLTEYQCHPCGGTSFWA